MVGLVTETGETRVVVRRPKIAWRDRFRSYQILIDGQVCGRIRNGGELVVAIQPGRHEIQAKISWTGSKAVSFTAAPAADVDVRVAPAGDAKDAIRQVLGDSNWLSLEITSA